jgi:hypothetical protein
MHTCCILPESRLRFRVCGEPAAVQFPVYFSQERCVVLISCALHMCSTCGLCLCTFLSSRLVQGMSFRDVLRNVVRRSFRLAPSRRYCSANANRACGHMYAVTLAWKFMVFPQFCVTNVSSLQDETRCCFSAAKGVYD